MLYNRACPPEEEEAEESPLRAYLDALPTSFETVPLTWSEADVAQLPGAAKRYLAKQRTVLAKHYALAGSFVQASPLLSARLATPTQAAGKEESVGGGLTESTFLWAWLVVNSRCIFQALSPSSTRDDNYACCPLIDMINHVPSAQPHCKLSYDIKGLSVISTSSYSKGEETCISYGAHANDALLCEYGFVLPRNSDNHLDLDGPLARQLASHGQRLLMEVGYWEDWTLDGRGHASFRTEVALRVAPLSREACEEGSPECRRLTQFVNGQVSGSRDQAAVDSRLARLVRDELVDSERALEALDTTGRHWGLIAQLWRDRVDILRAARDNLDGR